MKKLIILTLLFWGINITNAQRKYEKLWAEVESLEIEGKFESANKVVDTILKKARRSNESAQITRGFIYKSKFTLLLEEEAQRKIVSEMEAAIKESGFPTNVLLESVYASFLQQYLNKNRYKIRRRTKLDQPLQTDNFEKWDINTLVSRIAQHYELSLSNPEGLKKLPIKNFQEILKKSNTSHKFRPTLYDFLAHRALKFYQEDKWYVDKPKQRFYINNPVVFEPTKQLVKEPFFTLDSIFSNRNVLKLYQQLESFHEPMDTTAYVDVVLARLNFAKDKSIIKDKNDLYLKALQQLSKRFNNHESSAIINYKIANFYFEESKKANAKNDKVLKEYRIKALSICNQILKKYSNSDGGLLCTILKNKIEKESVNIEAEKFVVPQKPFLAKVSFKSVDSLYVSAYRVPQEYIEDGYSYKRDSVILEVIKERKPLKTNIYKLQPKKNFYQYTTEVDLPGLPIGNYLLVSSKTKEIESINDIYNHACICVSNLSMVSISRKKNLVVKVLDRQNGTPCKDVEIKVKNKGGFNKTGRTNGQGEFKIEKDRKYHNFKIVAFRKSDTIINRNHYMGGYYKKEADDEHLAKMFLYLDRSIYRPGQTIYFKGLLVERKNGKSSVVPHTFTSITIYDANSEELKEFRLKTNEYGTISGEFTLPRNVLTGEFTIEMDEDYGSDEEDEDAYYEKIDDFDYAEVNFSVEEYKRPKFEVGFDAITENYLVGDSIKVPGSANAFLGSTISGAKVKYSVSRKTMPDWGRNFRGSSSQVIKTGTTKTDAKGKFTINFIATPDSLSKKADKPVFIYTIKADVTDRNGETRSASQTVHVGYHNLKVGVLVAAKLNGSVPQKVKIETKNLNDQAIDAEVEVVINKLKSPDRVLRKKPWEIVELPSIPKSKFIKLFPHEPYDRNDVKKTWKKGKKVFSLRCGTSELKELTLNGISQWEPGAYNIEVKAIDAFLDTVVINKQVEVYHPNDKYLSDNQLFRYEIVNSDYKKDQFVALKLKTACKELKVNLEAYYKDELVFRKLITINRGSEIIKVPVLNAYKNKLDFNLYFTKFNSLHHNRFSVNFKEAEKELQIETVSFRNKLMPGQKETWSFKVTNSDSKNAKAEVLASMYDTSLDQFKSHSWNTNFGLRNRYYHRAADVYSNFFETNTFSNFIHSRSLNTISFLKNYHKLQWFGFNFGNSDYTNKKYLKTLADKKQNPGYNEGNVYGIVTDDSGIPMPGVSVVVAGTQIGTITDFDGFYSIHVPVGSELSYSFIGFVNEKLPITKPGTYNLAMTADMLHCDEVVVVAYGIACKKASVTGSVEYVTARDIYGDIARKLGGKVAGVVIMEEEETDRRIMIRGNSSITGSHAPLFIIDGVLMDAETGAQFSPDEIADISVLKGASATAIYGARAQNGVVVISTKKGLEQLTQVEVRSNLKETAFFFPHLKTNKNGEVTFTFDSPEALTKWKLMLLAHNKSMATGMLDKLVVTQKNLNVIPNAPRFLREGDTITLSTKISNLTQEALAGVAALHLYNGVTMKPIDSALIPFEPTKNFTISAQGNSSVAWHFKVPKGIPAIQYKIVAKSGTHSDGEMNMLPVLSNRTLVTEARPLWVPAGKSKEVEFEKLKTVNSKTQANHKFTLEYTSNPAWVAIKSLPYLMEFPHECAEQTFSRFYSNALAEVILEKNPEIEEVFKHWKDKNALQSPFEKNEELKSVLISESPWVRDLQSDQANKSRLAGLFDKEKVKSQQLQAISKLKELQLKSGGFPWFAGGRANRFITRHVVGGIGHLRKLDIICEYDNKLNSLLKKAIAYLDTELVSEYEKTLKFIKSPADVLLSHDALHYLYCRSFFTDTHPLSANTERVAKIYLEKCKTTWLTQSLYDQGMIALILHRQAYHKTAQTIIEALSEQAVNHDENGMYWKANRKSWHWYQSPIETQALLIEAFTEIDGDLKKVERLKQWLLKNKQTNNWSTTKATTEAIYALLMHGNDYLSISDNTVITVGDKKISTRKLEATKKEAATGYMKVSWGANEINSTMATVKISNKSRITGLGGIYWQYFEDLDKIQSSGKSPLSLKKTLFIKETNHKGETLIPITSETPVKLGDLVTVRIEIESKNDMEFVHLKDLRASGLEPVDVLSKYKWQDGLGYYQSTKDVATHFFFDDLPKGTYIFEYDLRANNSGNFSNGNSTIQSMYAPEFISNSKGTRLLIE